MQNENITLDTIEVGKITGEFYVPSYQRGYRWGEVEVKRLLEDIYSNGAQRYCLQPIVVRKDGERFELVDGQQRLTTLYLIYLYMFNRSGGFLLKPPKFSLKYEIREKSEEFLQNIDVSRREENIDFWFISNAYETIEKWFIEKGADDISILITDINSYLGKYVQVIRYVVEAPRDEAIALFARLNIGKIALTSAELVKAMFLSRDGRGVMTEERQYEIALQWDNIEKQLRNDALWCFLTNKDPNEYQTRIDLILDLIAKKKEGTKEKYYTFFKLMEEYQSGTLDQAWEKIQYTFLSLREWYEKHELYHKIGYLIAAGALSLQQIYDISENKKKAEFISILNDEIKKSISIKKSYCDLSYKDADDRARIHRLLLLFNVESVRKNGENTQWFPFDQYKRRDNQQIVWSLEHIHAQQSESLQKQEDWIKWIELHIEAVEALPGDQTELLARMNHAIASSPLRKDEFLAIERIVFNLLSEGESTEYIHSLSNMALLNSADNAALNNSTFAVKRNKIIEMDQGGQFIPFCTRMVFLKYYTPSAKNQLLFWGQADRKAYIEHMNKVLKPYLEKEISVKEDQ